MISDLWARLWSRSPAAAASDKPANPDKPSKAGITDAMALAADIVAEFEGFRADAYLCPAGVYTMGFGSTRDADGKPVKPGMRVSEAEARALLTRDLAGAAKAVDTLVAVPLAAHERAALISFVYNVGQGAFAASTMLRLLNDGDRDSAAAQFARWNKARGVVLNGLVRRRAAERAMFCGEDWRAER